MRFLSAAIVLICTQTQAQHGIILSNENIYVQKYNFLFGSKISLGIFMLSCLLHAVYTIIHTYVCICVLLDATAHSKFDCGFSYETKLATLLCLMHRLFRNFALFMEKSITCSNRAFVIFLYLHSRKTVCKVITTRIHVKLRFCLDNFNN